MTENNPPSALQLAATVLLLRDGPAGLEVFMQQRHEKLQNFSGALVFPGGKLEEQDRDPALRALCRSDAAEDELSLALRIAAIREAFEECGVLLARRRGETALLDASQVAELASQRDALNAGTLTLREMIESAGLELAGDQLVYFANWRPPAHLKKRFDTHFFLAPVPAGQQPLHDGGESVDSAWITATAALQGSADGRFVIVIPTRCNLQKLALRRDLADALTTAAREPVVRVETRFERREDGVYMLIPPEAGYPLSEQRLPDSEAGHLV